MEIEKINRQYLETLSNSQLISLGDELGIDIPEDLNRNFIIAELLEAVLEYEEDNDIEEIVTSEEDAPVHDETEKLPDSYNETSITALLRNPAWVYVYWDIKAADLNRLSEDLSYRSMCLRVSFWENEDDTSPVESFDVQVGDNDRQQYVLLTPGKNFVRIDLVALYNGHDDENLAITPKIALPKGAVELNEALPGRDIQFPKLVELSGMKELLTLHYENHRQSFS
ncbi:MAG: DUF4912 domain-containing protein [Treponema sp.]|nr:DUF4912 domain-containing protein [Treponema sp.]MBR0486599.1 DUF4912 domain-containing protein [Treponema sp.]